MPNSTDEQLDAWAKEYDKWSEENKHLPNLQPSNVILDRMKNARNQQMNPPAAGVNNVEQRIATLEQKIDKLMNHLGVK
jgi:hypothetical protein